MAQEPEFVTSGVIVRTFGIPHATLCRLAKEKRLPSHFAEGTKFLKRRTYLFSVEEIANAFAEMSAKRVDSIRRYEVPWKTEGAFQLFLVEQIRSTSDWTVRSGVHTPFGIVDILIEKPVPTLIEVKLLDGLTPLTHAVGQLMFYSQQYPDAHLFIATPNPVAPQYLPVLNRCGIREWEWDRTK